MSVAFSADNRQIVSGSRDKTIKLWNTLAECKYTIQDEGHSDWVSCVRFSPNHSNPIIVSAGWDRTVKVWNLANCKLKVTHKGHNGYLNTVTVSPDGSLCTSGGKDTKALLWDLNDNKHLHTLDHNDSINALCFSPNRYWLCVAYGPSIKIWVCIFFYWLFTDFFAKTHSLESNRYGIKSLHGSLLRNPRFQINSDYLFIQYARLKLALKRCLVVINSFYNTCPAKHSF